MVWQKYYLGSTRGIGMDNMTAKVSCFARAYHYNNNSIRIFTDDIAEKLLGEDYNQIAKSMSDGIDFFCPGFEGTREEGLRLILDRQLSPSVLGRSVFCESKLAYAIANGCKQYGQQVDYMYGEALYKPEMKGEYHILICKMRLGKPVQANGCLSYRDLGIWQEHLFLRIMPKFVILSSQHREAETVGGLPSRRRVFSHDYIFRIVSILFIARRCHQSGNSDWT
jgi:hypothetical protein